MTYDLQQSYQFNYDRGPVFADGARKVKPGPMKTFLG